MTKLQRMLAQQGLFIGGHRGFSARYPENTLLAVKEAVDLGVDLVEVDVYMARDGEPVIAHDHRLERCSDGTGVISDYTVAELKRFDFGIHRGAAFEGLRLPTLEQFLNYMRGYPDVLMDIDFKVWPGVMDTARRVLPFVERAGLLDRCVFNCIDCDVVAYVYERLGRVTVGAPDFYPHIRNFRPGKGGTFSQLWGICVPFKDLSQAVVDRYRDEGVAIVCTPADTPEQVDRAVALGVTLPLCNDPREYLRRSRE